MSHNVQPIPKPMIHVSSNNVNPFNPISLPLPSLTNMHYAPFPISIPIPHVEMPATIRDDVLTHLKTLHANHSTPLQLPIFTLPPIPGLHAFPYMPPIPPIPPINKNSFIFPIPPNIPMAPNIPLATIPPIPPIPPVPPLQTIPTPSPHTQTHSNSSNIPNHNTSNTTNRKRKRLPQARNRSNSSGIIARIELNHTQSTQNTDINSLPLGHPGRIQFIDTISEAFSDKYKNKKRSVIHRTWARPRKCRECGTTYPSSDDYDLHRMVYHSEGLQIDHSCPICGTMYKERRWLNRHVRNTHFKHVCKIDGNGTNLHNLDNAALKKRKGTDRICGYRFSEPHHLVAHQAIVHGVQNGYVYNPGERGPTLLFMNGTDTKNLVREQLMWNGMEHFENIDDENDDDLIDLSDITMMLKGNNMKNKGRKSSVDKKTNRNRSNTNKNKRSEHKKKSKKSKKKENVKRKLSDSLFEEQPVAKKQKVNKSNHNAL